MLHCINPQHLRGNSLKPLNSICSQIFNSIHIRFGVKDLTANRPAACNPIQETEFFRQAYPFVSGASPERESTTVPFLLPF